MRGYLQAWIKVKVSSDGIERGQFNIQVRGGWNRNIPPVKPNSPATVSSQTHSDPTLSSLPQSRDVYYRRTKQERKESRLTSGAHSFCRTEVSILSPNLVLLCTAWVQLHWLRPLVAPVSSSAPGP
ncbi:hypothetical protein Q5P01_022594 [Channa striata]|uniref:Uncharacterized protein n=1 Tax=Channa striata TaxID=64152 RepID=A0AA88IXH1_CHASR|nr:hypothetical protein Q5P01_022594 [Channa striata]